MKPNAPEECAALQADPENVVGTQICEHFPADVAHDDKGGLIRSLHYNTGASHENGQRWMMTGHDFSENNPQPHTGSVISRVFGRRATCRRPIILRSDRQHGTSTPHVRRRLSRQRARAVLLGSDPANSDFQVANLIRRRG